MSVIQELIDTKYFLNPIEEIGADSSSPEDLDEQNLARFEPVEVSCSSEGHCIARSGCSADSSSLSGARRNRHGPS